MGGRFNPFAILNWSRAAIHKADGLGRHACGSPRSSGSTFPQERWAKGRPETGRPREVSNCFRLPLQDKREDPSLEMFHPGGDPGFATMQGVGKQDRSPYSWLSTRKGNSVGINAWLNRLKVKAFLLSSLNTPFFQRKYLLRYTRELIKFNPNSIKIIRSQKNKLGLQIRNIQKLKSTSGHGMFFMMRRNMPTVTWFMPGANW